MTIGGPNANFGTGNIFNPSATGISKKTYNSPNHGGDGQNVSFGDNHVEFKNTPNVGQNQDNIYTTAKATALNPDQVGTPVTTTGAVPTQPGGSAGNYDIVMVPWADPNTPQARN